MVPDNRVLSLNVIRDIMAHSVKEGKDVAVFTQELLSLGGLISAETSVRRHRRTGADPSQRVGAKHPV